MKIHIYFSEIDIKDKNILTLGFEDVSKEISEKKEEIHTTELRFISESIAKIYDYVFHYYGEEVTLSKEEMDSCWFYNLVGRLYDLNNKKYKNFETLSKEIFDLVVEGKNNYINVCKKNKEKEKEISEIQNIFQYMRFRLKEIFYEEKIYLFFIYGMFISIFTEEELIEKILIGIVLFIMIGFYETITFWDRKKNGGKENEL